MAFEYDRTLCNHCNNEVGPKSGHASGCPNTPIVPEVCTVEANPEYVEYQPGAKQKKVVVSIGSEHVVTVDKLFGPWTVWPVRVRLDYTAGDWVIEQEHCRKSECGTTDNTFWVEMARFPGWPPTNTSCVDDID